MSRRVIGSFFFAALLLSPLSALAQTPTSATPAAANTAQHLSSEQLDQLAAPIALYPDPLLAEVLMASTYPVDVVHAERWLEDHKNLSADQLKSAADKEPWDQSIKALVATPDVLALMSSKLDWTQKLGNAVIAQQADVMDAVQRLRAKAQANNKLSSTKEQTVKVEQVDNRPIIAIEPTDPNTIYTPYYDPAVVYGEWPYPNYPPYYWPTPGYIGAGLIAGGIAFGVGYALGRWAGGGGYWGGSVNWNNNNININRPINGNGTRWQGGAGNRGHVAHRGGRQQGLNFRGSRRQQVLNPGAGRGNLGNRGGAGNRGHVAHRGSAGNRVNAGNRGGNRGAVAGNRGARGASVAHHRGGGRQHAAARGGGHARGGGMRAHGGGHGGGHRGGGGGRGGGRRSDIMLKHDIVLLGYLENGLGFYQFSFNGSDKPYVGVLAQEVQRFAPEAVTRGSDGYLQSLLREAWAKV